MRTQTKDNHAMRRFEIRFDGRVAGYIDYKLRPGTIVFTETVVEPRFAGAESARASSRTRWPGQRSTLR